MSTNLYAPDDGFGTVGMIVGLFILGAVVVAVAIHWYQINKK